MNAIRSTLIPLIVLSVPALAAVPFAAVLSAPALAADPPAPAPAGPATYADILTMLKDKNAKLKMDKVIAAALASPHAWTAKNVYELVDLGAPAEITKHAASKVPMFWDGTAPSLPATIATARGGAAAETVTIANNEELVIVFEHFNDLKYGIDGAKTQLGALAPKASYENDLAFDMRKREYDLKQAQLIGPWEGKIAKTTFDLTLTGGYTPHDGTCTRPQVVVDLTKVNFELFRYTMGGLRVEVPIALAAGSNVESAKWVAKGQYRFEATGKPICVSAAAAAALAAQGSKVQLTVTRPFDSDAWTGAATFYNAKTGAKL